MEIVSKNGKFTLKALDDCLTGSRYFSEQKGDQAEVEIIVNDNEKVSLTDIALVIFYECFDAGNIHENGLHLIYRKLLCHVKVKDKDYTFLVYESNSVNDTVLNLANQFFF